MRTLVVQSWGIICRIFNQILMKTLNWKFQATWNILTSTLNYLLTSFQKLVRNVLPHVMMKAGSCCFYLFWNLRNDCLLFWKLHVRTLYESDSAYPHIVVSVFWRASMFFFFWKEKHPNKKDNKLTRQTGYYSFIILSNFTIRSRSQLRHRLK